MTFKKLAIMFLLLTPQLIWASADNVTLFDQNRDVQQQEKKTPNESLVIKKGNIPGQKWDKKLIGVQRMDNRYTLIFKNKKGKQERFLWQQQAGGEAVEIAPGYQIESVNNRSVIIKLGAQATCQEDKQWKIECPDTEHMLLAIQRSKPVKRPSTTLSRKNIPAGRNVPVNQSKTKGIKKTEQKKQVQKKPANPFLSIINKTKEKQAVTGLPTN